MMPLTQSTKCPYIWFGDEIGLVFRKKLEEAYEMYPEYWNLSIQIHSVDTQTNIDPEGYVWNYLNIVTYFPVSNSLLAAMAVFEIPIMRKKFDRYTFIPKTLYITALCYAIVRLGADRFKTFTDVPFLDKLEGYTPSKPQCEFVYKAMKEYIELIEEDAQTKPKCNITESLSCLEEYISRNFPSEFNDNFIFEFSEELKSSGYSLDIQKSILDTFSIVYFNDIRNNINTKYKFFSIKGKDNKQLAISAMVAGNKVHFSACGQDE